MAVQLFLSCVSDEFGAYRDALRSALTRPNVEVKIQEDFKAPGCDTPMKLEGTDGGRPAAVGRPASSRPAMTGSGSL